MVRLIPLIFANYFEIDFDKPFAAHGTWTPEAIHEGQAKLAASHVGAYWKFKAGRGESVSCKVASSYISPV